MALYYVQQMMKKSRATFAQYHRMPRLSEADDYDQCMEEAPSGQIAAYCVARVVLRPDNSSELWNLIENFSKNWKRHYNHALLDRAVCMEDCKRLVRRLPNATRKALRVEKFAIDFPYIFDPTVYQDAEKDRDRYGELLDICVNYKLNESYRLRAYTEIEVCNKNVEPFDVDILDFSFLLVLATIIFLTILSSWYDKTVNYKQDVVHYKQELDSPRKMLFVSFSILRNWYRLTSRSHNVLDKDLRFFQAIRYLTMMLVILGHAALIYSIAPSQNTIKIEMMFHQLGTMILTGGPQIVQTFFAMSGFLLAVQMIKYAENSSRSPGILFLLKAIVYRYIRLTPVYAFVVLLHATWLPKLQDGPVWKLATDTERAFCRRNWWTNLLYVNNYVHGDQPCVQQGWYLGCDFQLFILGTLLLMVILKLRKFSSSILVMAALAAYLVPAYFIYYEKLEGIFLITLQGQRFTLWFDEFYQRAYIPLHVNLGNYLAGIIAGMIYLRLRQTNTDPVQKRWFHILWYFVFPAVLGTLLINYIFYEYDFAKPSLWMAAFYPIAKYSWGVYAGVFMMGQIYGISPILKRIFNHRVFEPLGRMTYSAYLGHVFVMRLTVFNLRTPIHFNYIGTFSLIFASAMFSYLMALVLCLLIEFPVSALQKLAFGGMRGNSKQANDLEKADEITKNGSTAADSTTNNGVNS
ncbi:AAEL014766-PA [Aedes aegypti]|uniref:AAEL014766-PA n=2 Tax=Aedes aegypti TaxID=7159 RepID=Q16FG4_AEDAE|nr:AAEL014766-PA [Aedes aegypti]